MDMGSLESNVRHISNVQRIETELESMLHTEKYERIESQMELASIRWAACRRSYAMLFMALNRGNRFPEDNFAIKVNSQKYGNETYDTFVRIWRNDSHQIFNAKPYVVRDKCIRDDSISDTESFGNIYDYHHGTYNSHSARVVFDSNEGDLPAIKLERVDGKLVSDMSDHNYAILLSAIEDCIVPSLEMTEDTLSMIYEGMLNKDYNPELAERVRLTHP